MTDLDFLVIPWLALFPIARTSWQQLLIDLEAAAKEGNLLGGESKAEVSNKAEKSTDVVRIVIGCC